MKAKRDQAASGGADPKEQLDSLNAHWQERRDPPNAIRRTIEAHIEGNTRKKRSENEMASWKSKRLTRG